MSTPQSIKKKSKVYSQGLHTARLDSFENILNYNFKDKSLLETALTHPSLLKATDNNQRLEFLGDAVLSLIASDLLFRKLPKAKEGDLTRGRASLTNSNALLEASRILRIEEFLKVEASHKKSITESACGDALEAIIGAVYLDGGLENARRLVLSWLDSQILDKRLLDSDPKSRLQELCQSRGSKTPTYSITDVQGTPPKEIFQAACCTNIGGRKYDSTGLGRSKKIAEQIAAAHILKLLSAHEKENM